MQPVIYQEKEMPIKEVCEALSSGDVVLYPTDTLYALGADPLQERAMEKLFLLKRRSLDKKVSYIFSDFVQITQYARITETAVSLQSHLPGKLTLILDSKKDGETIGARIPDNAFCLALAAAYGPITATSANISGEDDLHSVRDILEKISDIHTVVDGGELCGPASTVVDARGDIPKVLRQGTAAL